MPHRQKRRNLILELVSGNVVGSQHELAKLLASWGVTVTQATLSRDIRELGLVKTTSASGGQRYLPASQVAEVAAIAGGPVVLGIVSSGNLLVVKTRPGFAQSIASAIDQVRWSEVLGTVGGDDTVIVVLKETVDFRKVQERMRLFLNS